MELAERIMRGRRAIRLARKQGLDTSEWERHLQELVAEAGRKPRIAEGFQPWALWELRRVSIPDWQRILRGAIHNGDARREKYARWMLSDVLLDPEYEESES